MHEYDQIKEPKQSVPHHTSASGEQYDMSFNVVNSAAEKQQQQEVPLVEYTEIDNTKNKIPQQYNVTSGCDVIKDNGNTDSEEVSLHYVNKVVSSNSSYYFANNGQNCLQKHRLCIAIIFKDSSKIIDHE